jgi:dephospho-CoA kinase
LIGGIGSGKSQVARLLANGGAAVIDADAVGHELLGDPTVIGQVVERFGAGVLMEPGSSRTPVGDGTRSVPATVNRSALGAIVFADAVARQALESILHPLMRARFEAAIVHAIGQGTACCIVLDAAILLEAGWDDLCDWIVYVEAPRQDRIQRVASARGWSDETLASRERVQWPCDLKRRRAHFIIRNDTDHDRLVLEVDRLHPRLHNRSLSAPAPSRCGIEAPPDHATDTMADKIVLNSFTAARSSS